MDAAKASGQLDLSTVEFPVTLCWFPEYNGEGQNPHVAARKLFVDVNKNARQPSEARLVLLSDTELINIFTRALLNRLREKPAPFPLFSVEYDNPDKESSRPVRWSVFTNITMLRTLVEKAVFGPPKYIVDVSKTFMGKVSKAEMDIYMRRQLELTSIFPKTINDDDERALERETIGNMVFPQYNKIYQQKLIDQFMKIWGLPILHILGEFLPYKRHIAAVSQLRNGWSTDDSVASLAKDAMFEGVGMYWTLRASHQYWRERVQKGLDDGKSMPEIVKAWETVELKGRQFRRLRADHLLDSTHPDSVRHSESLYKIINTHACQVGAIMTLATVQSYHPKLTPNQIAKVLVKAWNAALVSSPVKSRTRILLLSKDEKHPLNMIPKMDSPHAVYFRYFFLQLLMAKEALVYWTDTLNSVVVQKLVSTSRHVYFDYLVKEKTKGYRRTQPGWSKSKQENWARRDVGKELAKSLSFWFEVSKEDFRAWLNKDEDAESNNEGVIPELGIVLDD